MQIENLDKFLPTEKMFLYAVKQKLQLSVNINTGTLEESITFFSSYNVNILN